LDKKSNREHYRIFDFFRIDRADWTWTLKLTVARSADFLLALDTKDSASLSVNVGMLLIAMAIPFCLYKRTKIRS